MKRLWVTLTLGFVCALVAAAGQAAYAALAGPTLVALMRGDAAIWLATAAACIALVRGIALIGESVWLGGSVARIGRDLRVQIHRRLLSLPLGFFRERSIGDLLARVLEDVRAIEASIAQGRVALVRECLAVAGLLAVAVWTEPRLFAIAVLALPLGWVGALWAGRRTMAAAREERDATGRLAAHVAEDLVAMREVKSSGREEEEGRRVEAQADAALSAAKRRLWARAMIPAQNEVAAALGLVGALGAGTYLSIAPERLVSFFCAMLLLYKPVKGIGQAVAAVVEAKPSRERIEEILARPVERQGGDPVPALEGEVRAHAVTFRYPGVARSALSRVSFEARVGEVVALVGPSGAGKTTLAQLLAGLSEPSEGEITWDSLALGGADLRSWRARCGVVGQQPILMDGCVREIVGSLDAAEAAGIEGLMDRRTGERGALLSAGEAQRVAIASALARRASLLILDEPSSALDPENERALVRALRSAAKGAAVVVISHREALAAHADRVVRMALGRIVVEGEVESRESRVEQALEL